MLLKCENAQLLFFFFCLLPFSWLLLFVKSVSFLLILQFHIYTELSNIIIINLSHIQGVQLLNFSLHNDRGPAARWTHRCQKDAYTIKSHCKPFSCFLEETMPLSYIMIPDINSSAVFNDVILFLNAEQGAVGLYISMFLVWSLESRLFRS